MLLSTTDLAAAARQHYAIVIIGAGAAGITLACELEGCGQSVLLLDAGTAREDASLADRYRGSAAPPHPPIDQYRRQGLGGTTRIWGGRCVPFDAIDFAPRAHVPGSGWPIAYDEVARHYPLALAYCDAGHNAYPLADALPGAAPTIGGARLAPVLEDRIERYSLPTDFGQRYRARLAAALDVRVLPGVRCVALQRAAGCDRLAAIEVVDLARQRARIMADRFVLATGGIEAARLLLASGDGGAGLGNARDRVGRHYGCHFENSIGRLVPNGSAVQFAFERDREGIYVRRKLQFSAEAQIQHRLLNTAFRLHFPDYSDARHGSAAMSAIYLAKSALIPEYRGILQHTLIDAPAAGLGPHLRNISFGLPQLLQFIGDWLFRRQLATRKLPYTLIANADGSYPLEFNSEQTPLASSRITLLGERDADGLPRVRVDWRLSADDIDAACRAFRLLRETIAAHGTARLEFDDARLREQIAQSVPLGGHHLGTTRMAASASNGVVDGNCALFEVPNLFVASSAVFTTGSHANPTLTIVALAIRLAAHLRSARPLVV